MTGTGRLKLGIFATAIVALIPVGGRTLTATSRSTTESIRCGNLMVSLGCCGRAWADNHGGQFPTNLASMADMLGAPDIYICPGDHARKTARNWAEFTTNTSSYEISATGIKVGDTNTVWLKCKLHGHLGYADMTVFDGKKRRLKIP